VPCRSSLYDSSPSTYNKFRVGLGEALPSAATLQRMDREGPDDSILGPGIALGALFELRQAADARGMGTVLVSLGNDDVMLRRSLLMLRERLMGFAEGAHSWDVAPDAPNSSDDEDESPDLKRVRDARATHMNQWMVSSLDEVLHFPVASILIHESDKARAAKQVWGRVHCVLGGQVFPTVSLSLCWIHFS
jgi:hypothetical protein